MSQKCPATKKKEAMKQISWALDEIKSRYETKSTIADLGDVIESLQIS